MSETGSGLHPAADSTAAASVVTYRNGQLTIDAKNETLAQVLALVAAKTGAVIDVPPGSGLEHIVEHTGPGQPNDVITQLLNGSHFNFIIVSSAQDPAVPAQVLLTVQKANGEAPVVAAGPAPAANPALWTPPEQASTVPILPPNLNNALTPPKEQVSPEALGELMKEKAKELREKAQQEAPPQ